MAISVVNDTGESDIYVGFSNNPTFDVSSTIQYFMTKLPLGTDDQVYKMDTNDTYYDSKDYKYVMIIRKSLTGGALAFKVQDLVDGYSGGDTLTVRVTTSIDSTSVYSAYHDKPAGETGYNTNYPNGVVPIGSTYGSPVLFVKLPSYTITSNVAKSADPSDYVVGEMISGPVFAYAADSTPLKVVQGVPFVTKTTSGGFPVWIIYLLLVVFIACVIGAIVFVYHKKKNRF